MAVAHVAAIGTALVSGICVWSFLEANRETLVSLGEALSTVGAPVLASALVTLTTGIADGYVETAGVSGILLTRPDLVDSDRSTARGVYARDLTLLNLLVFAVVSAIATTTGLSRKSVPTRLSATPPMTTRVMRLRDRTSDSAR